MNEKNYLLATELRHELHAHPELSMNEAWTKQHLMEFLKEHTTKFEIVDRGLWFYAVYRAEQPKKKIAFRGDFDAIPVEDDIDAPYKSQNEGVGHKCGHDGHVANLCLVALEIEENGCDNDVYLLYPNEDGVYEGDISFIDSDDLSATNPWWGSRSDLFFKDAKGVEWSCGRPSDRFITILI